MSDVQLVFELSPDELAFMNRLALREPSLGRFLSQGRAIAGGKHAISLGRADAEQLRTHLTELLAKIGFGSDYSPNEQGQLLEELIDKFYCQ